MVDVVIIRPISFSYYEGQYMRYLSIPHGPLHLASTLVEKGYSVKIIDEIVEDDAEGELRKALSENPICVGISTMSGVQIKNGLKFAEMVKDSYAIPVVWGGAHPTMLPMSTLEDPMVDIVVYGEGENSFVELVSALKRRKTIGDIKGICYKAKGKLYENKPAEPVDYDTLPSLPYHLINMERYITSVEKRKITRYFELFTSKGCPHRCAFCWNSIIKDKWRGKSIDKIVNEIKFLVENYGIDGITFAEDYFFPEPRRIMELCEKIIEKKLVITYRAGGTRVDDICRLDDSLLALMKKAGFDHFSIGAESGSDRILKYTNKRITVEQIYQANRRIKKYGFAVTYNFMAALPSETIIDFVETLKLILGLLKSNEDIVYPIAGPVYYTPFPQTVLWDVIIRTGFKSPESFRDWMTCDLNSVGMTTWVSEELLALVEEARGVVNELNKKFIGENAIISPADYKPLEEMIERGVTMSEGKT